MRDALMRDLDGYSLGVLLDHRVSLPAKDASCAGLEVFTVDPDVPLEIAFPQALEWADGVWLIAPETGGVLEDLSRQVIMSGKKLFGSGDCAVALTADKYRTLKHLHSLGIATVPCWKSLEFDFQWPPPWVIKPLDGVGCEGVYKTKRLPGKNDKVIIQPFIEGESLSLSALFDSGRAVLLSVNRQILEETEGGFGLLGCEVNGISDVDGSWQGLCLRIAAAIPQLWGYAGVDLIRGKEGHRWVLEINPRLTLSYAGLTQALDRPIARMVVEMATGEMNLEQIAAWREGLKCQSVWVNVR